jgi:predicted metalloprotease with PDZ domain
LITLPSHTRRFALLALFVLPLAVFAQSPGPQPIPQPPAEAQPADTPYAPGAIALTVDLSDVTHRVIQVDETIPVAPGELTLFYPEWIPGYHEPGGPISKIAGLVITGKKNAPLAWHRDPIDVFAFHVTVPEGVKDIHVAFQYLQPVRAAEGRFSASDAIIDLEWHTVVLYPAGHFARQIQIAPTLRLPSADWHIATALDVTKNDGTVVHFATTTLNTFIDSPLYAGLHYKRINLSPDAGDPVFLNLFGDSDANIALTPEQIQLHKNLATQAQKLYASHHYRHYDFLYLISDKVGGVGTEHHESSEDGSPANYFTDWQGSVAGRDLLAHEYTHSWNGKFRRPADLWTPDFNVVPMQGSLLWVYEGMTQYWGFVLSARAGLRSASDTRDIIAGYAAGFDASPGRKWRPLEDTTTQPVVSQRSPVSWVSWQRPEDYYTEGLLIWLDADTKIRELSGGKKSLDDFVRLFLGKDSPSIVTETYTFDDVVHDLNAVQPYDWAGFLHTRIYELAPKTPVDGFTRGGYKLVYTDTAPAWRMALEKSSPVVSFAYSLGFVISTDGTLGNVWWDSPAFKAGLVPDMHLIAVNDKVFSMAVLRQAILDAEKSKEPIRLTLKRDDDVKVISMDYHDGLRYPYLQRVDGTPDRLNDILAPLP